MMIPSPLATSLARRRPVNVSARHALMLGGLVLLSTSNSMLAASATWNVNADGNWVDNANWNPAAAPGGVGTTNSGDTAFFANAITAAHTVTVDTGRNVLGIEFDTKVPNYTLSGGSLFLTAGGFIQTAFAGNTTTDAVNSPITLGGDAAFNTNSTNTGRILAIGGTVTGSPTATSSTLTLAGVGISTNNNIAGAITNGAGGTLAVVKNGTGTWAFNSTANTFSGGLTVNGGTMRTGSTGNTTALFGTGPITLNGNNSTLNFGSTSGAVLNNDVVVNGANFLTVRGGSTISPTSLTGTGTLTIGNSNSAATTITATTFQNFAGTIDVQPNGANATVLRLGTAYVQTSLQNATLNLGSTSSLTQQVTTNGTITTAIGALTGTGILGGSGGGAGTFVYSVGSKNINSTFDGTIVNGTNASALNKVGTGALMLTGVSTYTGGTTVNGGTLLVNGGVFNAATPASSTSGTGSGAVTVTAGTLGGTGAINVGANTVNVNTGAFLAPGAGAPGMLSVVGTQTGTPAAGAGTLNLNTGSTFAVEISGVTPGTSYDQINLVGTVTLGGGNLTLTLGGFTAPLGTPFTIVSNDGTATSDLVFGTFAQGVLVVADNGQQFAINYAGGDGNDIVLMAVPEPSTYALLGMGGLGGIGLALARRRRRALAA